MEIDQDRLAVASGQEVKAIDRTFEPEEGLILSGFAKRPAGRKKQKVEPEEQGPNLELTAEDLAYIEANEEQ